LQDNTVVSSVTSVVLSESRINLLVPMSALRATSRLTPNRHSETASRNLEGECNVMPTKQAQGNDKSATLDRFDR